MMPRFIRLVVFVFILLGALVLLQRRNGPSLDAAVDHLRSKKPITQPPSRSKNNWREVRQFFPVEEFTPLPTQPPAVIPKIQADFKPETGHERQIREQRQGAVRKAFRHSWKAYKKNAWLFDEVGPISGTGKNTLGGWAATLIDSLDTLWVMGLKHDFDAAVREVKGIDFTTTKVEELNVFETNIRYLGGLLSAYDISGQEYQVLLDKAVELGDMLYAAWDTPNRMPVIHWYWNYTLYGWEMEGLRNANLAEVGSFSLEFTRLSQLTGNPKWYDAIARMNNLFAEQQDQSAIPGLWPVSIDTMHARFALDKTFTLAGLADSFYEYIPKQHLMLGGRSDQYREMYLKMLPPAKENLFFQPRNPENRKFLMAGTVQRHPSVSPDVIPEINHLTCFVGGMVALGAKIFEQPWELETARQLVDGCTWAYDTMPSKIMPDVFQVEACKDAGKCEWNEEKWLEAVAAANQKGHQPPMSVPDARKHVQKKNIPPGITNIIGSQYHLRPEAIESLFVLYRITGDEELRTRAWAMFETIVNATQTEIAFASLQDVREPVGAPKTYIDEMQSFWTAETLKYFYLIFSEPELVSLDDYVFNTEAHPLLRPK